MKHLGNITKMKGFTTPAVDIVTAGILCQDSSIAGKRAGLAGFFCAALMNAARNNDGEN